MPPSRHSPAILPSSTIPHGQRCHIHSIAFLHQQPCRVGTPVPECIPSRSMRQAGHNRTLLAVSIADDVDLGLFLARLLNDGDLLRGQSVEPVNELVDLVRRPQSCESYRGVLEHVKNDDASTGNLETTHRTPSPVPQPRMIACPSGRRARTGPSGRHP